MLDTDLFTQQRLNRRRSVLLIVGFIVFFAWLGFGGDLIAYLYTKGAEPGQYRHPYPFIGIVLTVLGVGMAIYAWKRGPERVLWSTKAREVLTPSTIPEQKLVNVVEEMTIASGIPKPRVWIVPDEDANAFATGRDMTASHIAVTEGLLAQLDRSELQAVVAHEMAHVKNLDVRLMTLLAALVGAVTLIGDGLGRILFRGGARGIGRASGGGKKKGGGNPILVVLLILWILSWILAPIITRLLALGVSRRREYLADAMAAQFTRNPLALASALEKIEHSEAATKTIHRGSAHLCIADPLGRKSSFREGRLADWFGTHPPMAIRVSRLKAMAYQEAKRVEAEGVPAR
jgi:heat shock protein HtpX